MKQTAQDRAKRPVPPQTVKQMTVEVELQWARAETSRWQRYACALEERLAPSVVSKIKKMIFG